MAKLVPTGFVSAINAMKAPKRSTIIAERKAVCRDILFSIGTLRRGYVPTGQGLGHLRQSQTKRPPSRPGGRPEPSMALRPQTAPAPLRALKSTAMLNEFRIYCRAVVPPSMTSTVPWQ